MVTWNPVKLTAMHHQHLSLGATMTDDGGWQRPARYASPEQELETVRTAGGLCDTSPSGKFSIQGSEVDTLLRRMLSETKDEKLEINTAAVGDLCRPDGSTVARVAACRFANDEIFITSSPENVSPIAQALQDHLAGLSDPGECAHMVDMTSNFATVTLAGPLSGQLLAKLTELNLSPASFPNLSCAQGQLAEVYTIILRWDRGRLPSYDVHFGRDFGEYMWEALLEAGQEYGMVPFGIEALKLFYSG